MFIAIVLPRAPGPFLLATLAMFVLGASAFGFRKRRAAGAEIRCREANTGEEFPWCKTSAKDVVIDEKTIAQDLGFFLVFFAGAMVFQSTVPVTLGILFTNWEIGPLNLFSAARTCRRHHDEHELAGRAPAHRRCAEWFPG